MATIVSLQELKTICLLKLRRFFGDTVSRICQDFLKEALPFRIGEGIVVQEFELFPEVSNQFWLTMDRQICVALFPKKLDEFTFQISLTLVR